MRLTVRSILLGVGVAVAIPVDPTTSHDDPKVIVVPLEPAYYPPGLRTTHSDHQATVPTSTPVVGDVVPEANAIQALEARRDIIGAQKFRCMAECLHIVPQYLLPIEPRFANCQRHCSQVVGEIIAGDDDDDSYTSPIQAQDATHEADDDQLSCIRRCLGVGDSAPASDHREKPAIAKCRRWCSTNSQPETTGEDDDQDPTSPIEARDALPEPLNPNIWCTAQCQQGPTTEDELDRCLSRCPRGSGPDFDLQPGGPAPAGFLQARDALPPPSNSTLSCALRCHRKGEAERAQCYRKCREGRKPKNGLQPARPPFNSSVRADPPPANSTFTCFLKCYRKDKAEQAQCYRECRKERKSKPGLQPTKPPSNSSIEVRSGADPDDIAPPGSIECLADCLRGPAQTQEEVDAMAKCMRRCSDALGSPGNNTTTNGTLATAPSLQARDAPPPETDLKPLLCLMDCMKSLPDGDDEGRKECRRRCAISQHPQANETLTAAVPDNNDAQDQENPYSGIPSVLCLIDCMRRLPGDGDDEGRKECARRCIPGRNTTTTAAAATTLDNGPIGSSTTTTTNEAREVHPEGLFRSSCGDPECEPNCLRAIPPESTEERRKCLRRCCPTRGQEGKAHEEAHHLEEDGIVLAVVEKRDCGSDCIANSHSKPEETACFQKCQDKGELNFTDPTGQQPPSPI